MRNTPNGALAFALASLAGAEHRRKTVTRAPKPPKELSEREKWNAEVEAKKAAKKARRASTKESGNGMD